MKKAYDKEKQRNEEISIPKRPLQSTTYFSHCCEDLLDKTTEVSIGFFAHGLMGEKGELAGHVPAARSRER